MKANLTWLGLTASDRDRARRIFDLLEESGTVDELGLGSLRDAFSDSLFPGEHRIERHVPTLPYSTEVEAFARLRRQLAAYRVVFGQSRQQELLNLLDQADVEQEDLETWSIDFSLGRQVVPDLKLRIARYRLSVFRNRVGRGTSLLLGATAFVASQE